LLRFVAMTDEFGWNRLQGRGMSAREGRDDDLGQNS
jgi:hypothetical protein